jgi:hypothetical protein
MFRKPRLHFAAILLACLCAQATFAAPTQDTQKIKLAALKLTSFTVFPSPKGLGQYEGGKILDMLKQEGSPELIKSMTPTLAKQQPDTIIIEPPPPKTVESKKRPKWRLIALGGTAVGGVVTAVLLSSRGGSKETAVNEGLPRPPKTP